MLPSCIASPQNGSLTRLLGIFLECSSLAGRRQSDSYSHSPYGVDVIWVREHQSQEDLSVHMIWVWYAAVMRIGG